MSDGLNKVILCGNLGADPELRYGQGTDSAVLRLRIACTESYFDKVANERKETTEWINVVIFGKRAEGLQKILSKGSRIVVEGKLQTRSYEKDGAKHYSTSVVALNVILAGGGSGTSRTSSTTRAPSSGARPGFDRSGGAGGQREFGEPPPGYAGGGEDDDIPF